MRACVLPSADGCRGECASNRVRRDDRCIYLDARCFARVENNCWSACIDGLTSMNTAEIIKGRAVSDILSDSLNLHNQQWRGLCTFKCFSFPILKVFLVFFIQLKSLL